jgi:hypothetical protein
VDCATGGGPGRRVVHDDVGLDPVVRARQQRHARPPAVAQGGDDVGEPVTGAQHPGPDEVRGDVAVAEGEPRRLGLVGGQLLADRPRLPRPPPPALGVDAAAEGVEAAVEVRGDPQAVHPDVVADVHDGSHLVLRVVGAGSDRRQAERGLHPEQEPGAPDPADQHRHLHAREPTSAA